MKYESHFPKYGSDFPKKSSNPCPTCPRITLQPLLHSATHQLQTDQSCLRTGSTRVVPELQKTTGAFPSRCPALCWSHWSHWSQVKGSRGSRQQDNGSPDTPPTPAQEIQPRTPFPGEVCRLQRVREALGKHMEFRTALNYLKP